MRVLVTGGAGFIGSSILRALIVRGDRVRVLDNFATGKAESLVGLPEEVEVVNADIRDKATCFGAATGIEAVLHQAALGSVPRSVEDPETTHFVNVDGTLNLLLAARDRGVRRFVFASSSSIYGDAPERVKTESLVPRPQSPYAVSKLAAEAYAVAFWKVYGLETVALRYFNVFGPRQDPASMYAAVVPRFAARLLAGEAPTIYGDGLQSRDFTYVDNVVRANLLAMECPREACGQAYNVACGSSISINDLFASIRGHVGGEAAAIEPVHEPPRKGDVRDSLASVAAAKQALGYEPGVSVEEGIRRTVAWYREQGEAGTRRT